MIFPLFRRTRRTDTIEALYGAIVAQAREPAFYAGFGVPDTVQGRFEMIVLHVALFCRRVDREPAALRALGQELFDRFCKDMEHNLREMGVSDLAVPGEMRRLGAAFYRRAAAYRAALAADVEDALPAALARNILPDLAAQHAGSLAAYVRAAAAELAQQDACAYAGGTVRFPSPVARAIRPGDPTSSESAQ
jgi:cytochrome b pre-mRNA-processing protein 3